MYLRVLAIQDLDQDKDKVFEWLFQEIDQDGSGVIDKTEFRYLLRALKLTYSDDRFGRLFAAVDVSGDGEIGLDEFKSMMTFSEQEIADIQRMHGDGGEKSQGTDKDKNNGKEGHKEGNNKKKHTVTNLKRNRHSKKGMRTLDEIADNDEKNDDNEDSDNDEDEVITYMKPSEVVSRSRQSSSIGDCMRSLGSVDYSDTDSENEGGPNASPGRRISRKAMTKSPGPLENNVLEEVLDEDNSDQTPPSSNQQRPQLHK